MFMYIAPRTSHSALTPSTYRRFAVSLGSRLNAVRLNAYESICAMLDDGLIIPRLPDGGKNIALHASGSSAQQDLDSFINKDLQAMEAYLERKATARGRVLETIKTNLPFDQVLPTMTMYRNEWHKMCSDSEVLKIGIVNDLAKLVNDTLEAFLWCAKLIDAYKAEKALQEEAGQAEGEEVNSYEGRDLYGIWLEHIQKGKRCVAEGSEERMRQLVDEAEDIAVNAEGASCSSELLRQFEEKRDVIEILGRRCVNMQRHLPILSKRLGAAGQQMETMFDGLLAIVKERSELFSIVCEIERAAASDDESDGEDDDELNVNFECQEFFHSLEEKLINAGKSHMASTVATRLLKSGRKNAPARGTKGGNHKNSGGEREKVQKWDKGLVEGFLGEGAEGGKVWRALEVVVEEMAGKGEGEEWEGRLEGGRAALQERRASAKKLASVLLNKTSFALMMEAGIKVYGEQDDLVVGEMLQADLKDYLDVATKTVIVLKELLESAKDIVAIKKKDAEAMVFKLEANAGEGEGEKAGGVQTVDGKRIVCGFKDKLNQENERDGKVQRCSNYELTDKLLKAATDETNLAMMFEGWVSWF